MTIFRREIAYRVAEELNKANPQHVYVVRRLNQRDYCIDIYTLDMKRKEGTL